MHTSLRAWAALAVPLVLRPPSLGAQSPDINSSILNESTSVTPQVSTEELQHILAEGKIPVLDVRSAPEYALAHIPGSVNIYDPNGYQVQIASITAENPWI